VSSRRSVTNMVGGLVVSAALLAGCGGTAPARDVPTVPVPFVTSPTAQPWEVQR